MTIEQRVADLEAKMLQLSAFLDTAGTYQSRYSGEELDEYLDRISSGFDTSDLANRQLSNLDTPQLALANIGAGVRPNMFINGDFRSPVNQIGTKDTVVSSGQFILDRWMVAYDSGAAPIFNSSKGYISLNNSGGSGNLFLQQNLELTTLKEGKQYTISLLCESGLYSAPIKADGNRVYVPNSVFNSVIIKQSSKYQVQIGVATGGNENILIAKLEEGLGQTVAYKTTGNSIEVISQPNRNELIECQSYKIRIGSSTEYPPIGIGQARTSELLAVYVPIPTTMRIKPTAVLNGSLYARNTNSEIEISYVSSDGLSPGCVLLSAAVSGATAGAIYDVYLHPNSFLTLDAEIR